MTVGREQSGRGVHHGRGSGGHADDPQHDGGVSSIRYSLGQFDG